MATEPASQGTAPPPRKVKRRPQISRRVLTASVVWFFGFLMFVGTLPVWTPDELPPWLILAYIAGSLAWLVSAYCTYHALFAMAEARWPEAKGIREILSP